MDRIIILLIMTIEPQLIDHVKNMLVLLRGFYKNYAQNEVKPRLATTFI